MGTSDKRSSERESPQSLEGNLGRKTNAYRTTELHPIFFEQPQLKTKTHQISSGRLADVDAGLPFPRWRHMLKR